MIDIYMHGRSVSSIFGLLGDKENDMTASVAWVLSRSPRFLSEFLRTVAGIQLVSEKTEIHVQEHSANTGFTDIEIRDPKTLHVIIEAKRNWEPPGKDQLLQYSERFSQSSASIKILVSLSQCTAQYAIPRLPVIPGVQMRHVSWSELTDLAEHSAKGGTHAEKRLIADVCKYLRGVIGMNRAESNWVYVVSVSREQIGDDLTFQDVVTRFSKYFHPVGINGWPKEPPNYIGFRWSGKLQQVHHIDSYTVVDNLAAEIPGMWAGEWSPHFLYTLGPPIRPAKDVRNGRIHPQSRLWCMLDTLLTCDTVAEARDLSAERAKAAGIA